jgi:large subunit ribosomal protein L1
MPRHGKRYEEILEKVDREEFYSIAEAVKLVKETATASFDEAVDMAVHLNVNPSKGEQNVRGTITLPHGTGRVPRVAVFAEGEAAKEAEEAGADRVGAEDLVEAIQEGWSEFDVLVAQPQLMKIVGPLGKILGPRMPSKKGGNVIPEVAEAVRALKSGRMEYRVDRNGVVHAPVGRVSFTEEQLEENIRAFVGMINQARPASVSGRYILSVYVSATMGPGIKISLDEVRSRAA